MTLTSVISMLSAPSDDLERLRPCPPVLIVRERSPSEGTQAFRPQDGLGAAGLSGPLEQPEERGAAPRKRRHERSLPDQQRPDAADLTGEVWRLFQGRRLEIVGQDRITAGSLQVSRYK